jgi:hypothetical protein
VLKDALPRFYTGARSRLNIPLPLRRACLCVARACPVRHTPKYLLHPSPCPSYLLLSLQRRPLFPLLCALAPTSPTTTTAAVSPTTMADNEKSAHDVNSMDHSIASGSGDAVLTLPNSWKYKSFTFLGYKLPWFASPPVQLIIVSFVCFMCPGMFNALNGMGGGGQLDPTANNKANTALYSTFAVVGFFAGTFTNKLGIRTALSFGGIGYSIYVASYLSYNHTQNLGFTTFAGALLGVCAGLLWCAQGAIMMSYPPEGSKGRYISWFWMIFNLGAVIGGLVCHPLWCYTESLLPYRMANLPRSPLDRTSIEKKPHPSLTAPMSVSSCSRSLALHYLGRLLTPGMLSEQMDPRSL